MLYAPIILSAVLAGETFFEYKSLHKFWKIFLLFLIVLASIINIHNDDEEKKADQAARNWEAQMNASGLGAVGQAIVDLKPKDNPFKMEQNETASMFLDRNFLRLKDIVGTDNMVGKDQYLTIYFDEVSKIPTFYSLDEWKETENILYTNMLGQIDGYFASRGNPAMAKVAEKEFSQERLKLIKAKKRSFHAQPA